MTTITCQNDLEFTYELLEKTGERLALLRHAEQLNAELNGHLEGDFPDIEDAICFAKGQRDDLLDAIDAYTGNMCIIPKAEYAGHIF